MVGALFVFMYLAVAVGLWRPVYVHMAEKTLAEGLRVDENELVWSSIFCLFWGIALPGWAASLFATRVIAAPTPTQKKEAAERKYQEAMNMLSDTPTSDPILISDELLPRILYGSEGIETRRTRQSRMDRLLKELEGTCEERAQWIRDEVDRLQIRENDKWQVS